MEQQRRCSIEPLSPQRHDGWMDGLMDEDGWIGGMNELNGCMD